MKKPLPLILVAFAGASLANAAAPAAMPSAAESTNTIITSEGPLEMQNNGVDSYFVFTKNVRLTGTNLEVTCDKLEIFADQRGDKKATVGKPGDLRRILATGHVVISQEGRKATAGRVEVLPRDDKILLTEEPVVTQGGIVTSGDKITFLRGEQKAIVENPRVVGGPMRNLGFAPQPGDAGESTAPAPANPPSTSPAPGG